ncbi:MAG: hypothetical protein ACLTDF_11195 [Coprococcus sp.]
MKDKGRIRPDRDCYRANNSIIESSKNEIHENRLARERAEGEINVINQQIIHSK